MAILRAKLEETSLLAPWRHELFYNFHASAVITPLIFLGTHTHTHTQPIVVLQLDYSSCTDPPYNETTFFSLRVFKGEMCVDI